MIRRGERTKTWTRAWLGAVAVIAVSSWGACSSEDSSEGGGATGGTGGARPDGSSGSGGTGGTPGLTCGGQACPALSSQASQLGVTACCTTADVCGLQTPLAESCLEPELDSGVDPTCPSFSAQGGFTLPGCCMPDGQCGAFAGAIGAGCIANSELGVASQACDYDPNNRCTWLADLPCDGSEDCPGEQVCCGHFQGGGYTEFACRDSCDQGEGGMADLWLELCHPGQTCADATYQCRTSTYLPDFMFRCYTDGDEVTTGGGSTAAGEVNCGATSCVSGEKCCLRRQAGADAGVADPYCAPAADPCTCNPGGGAGGAGGAAGAAGGAGEAGGAGAAGAAGAGEGGAAGRGRP